MTSPFETERLRLREFTRGDLAAVAAMVADEEQMTFYPRPKTREEASAWINRNLSCYKEYGFGFWCVESRATAAFAGYCGIRPLALDGASEIVVGWPTKKALWNRGFATQAALAARDLAFERFALPRLVAVIHPEHIASRRVTEKTGMHVEKRVTVEEDYAALIYVSESVAPARGAR